MALPGANRQEAKCLSCTLRSLLDAWTCVSCASHGPGGAVPMGCGVQILPGCECQLGVSGPHAALRPCHVGEVPPGRPLPCVPAGALMQRRGHPCLQGTPAVALPCRPRHTLARLTSRPRPAGPQVLAVCYLSPSQERACLSVANYRTFYFSRSVPNSPALSYRLWATGLCNEEDCPPRATKGLLDVSPSSSRAPGQSGPT